MQHDRYRDGFIGDVFTSTVRPLQDLAFTVFYIFSGLRGWWTQAYGLDDAQLPLESQLVASHVRSSGVHGIASLVEISSKSPSVV